MNPEEVAKWAREMEDAARTRRLSGDRRFSAAKAALTGILADSSGDSWSDTMGIAAALSVRAADALLAELDRTET